MPNSQELKDQIQSDITDKTAVGSISPANVGDNLEDIVDYVDQQANAKVSNDLTTGSTSVAPSKTAVKQALQDVKPYKTLEVLLSHTGQVSPTMTVLKNDFPVGFSFARIEGAGYLITSSDYSNVFTDGKTVIDPGVSLFGNVDIRAARDSANQISIYTYYDGYMNNNGHIDKLPVEIRVYP